MEASEITTAEEFGVLLRELRGRLTQQAVARRSEIDGAALTRQRVSNIENGAVPTAEQLRCYVQGCGKPGLFDEFEPVRRRIRPPAVAAAGGAGDEIVHLAPPERTGRVPWRLVLSAAAVLAVTVVSTAAAVVVLMDGGASDGTASAGAPDCVDGHLCFWPEPNFLGRKITLPPDYATGSTCEPLPFVARSAQNNSKERQRLFAGTDCTGQVTILHHLDRVPLPSLAVLSYRHS
ncbi:peptidase inhibitor family I36 protein [Spirillospora sp. NBC_01491]|uniref:peptidase inhibitor family I36 protein n=1 Tax=Spirillospora sp. NBC_01491 TaxID=2976007 RepID=UPI002E340F1E|nr:peptidase inhibitor family I36 protein [Spirillospora sp. NBC_01491]